MLSKKDVALLRGMFDEQEIRLEKKLTKSFDERFDIRLSELKKEIRDEIHSCISASEHRMMKYINDIKEEIIDGITDTLDEGVFPQIFELQTDMARVKNRLQMT